MQSSRLALCSAASPYVLAVAGDMYTVPSPQSRDLIVKQRLTLDKIEKSESA